MKTLCLSVCFLFAVPFVHAAAGDAFDRTAAEGAAKLVLASVAEDVLAGGDVAKTNLYRNLLADPGRFRSADLARVALKDPFRKDVEKRYADEAAKVLARLARPRTAAEAFPAAFREKAARLPDGAAEHAAEEVYPKLFTAARQEACAAQAKTLAATVHPTEAEVDALATDDLRKLLVDRLAANQQTPVFEENLGYITDQLAAPLIEEAYAQKAHQADMVKRFHPRAFAPTALAAELTGAIGAVLADEKAKAASGAWVYGLFPSVTNSVVPACAEKAALQRLADGVAEASVDVTEDEVFAVYARDPAAHVKRAASDKAIAAHLGARVRAAGAAATAARAPEAERAEFGTFAAAHAEDAKGVFAAAARRRVADDLLPKVQAIREKGVQRQLAATYPSVADGTWFPGGALTDAVCERSDYKIAVKGWRDLPGLEGVSAAGRGKQLFEETDAQADAALEAAFERARGARTAQLEEVKKQGSSLGQELKAGVTVGRGVPTLEEIIELLTRRVETAWESARMKVLWTGVPEEKQPKNASEQHRDLFPSVKTRIEETAKALREMLEKPPEPTPEETPPEPEEKKLPVEVPCELVLDWQNGEISIDLLVDGALRKQAKCPSDPTRYESALKDVRDALSATFEQTLRDRAGTESVKFAVVVRNPFVYCGTAETLLRALSTAAGAAGIAISQGSDALGWTYGR